ncbi:T9SS type A sorting domain-containing protein [Larkinella insperata]|uniref:T9SS type A sorting domain-containing protein n=1 Tax=Larkinella insperata TaxID=332158 RepID=A0ABW3QFQ0_9BACT|nr:T9SS type A sorting domain-containing protein [Larkinella insperata]
MKQPVRLYAWLTGLVFLVSQSLLAQTDSSKPKSRLELGQKPAPTSRVIHSRNFPFLKHPTVASLDRGVTVQKNTAINQYYRNQLLNATTTKTARATGTESSNVATPENRQISAEETRKSDKDFMYSNDQITVSNIYPNPANEFAEIDYKITGNVKDAKLTFYNVLGAQVADHTLDGNEGKVRIVTRDMNSGLYFYRLSIDNQKIVTKKLMVSHQ